MSIGVQQPVAPIFPDGYPAARRLAPLLHSAVRDVKRGRDYRRRITRDPLLFAMLYLTPYLQDEVTGVLSFSDLHLAMYDRALRWAQPVADHSAWAKYRDAGGTTTSFLVWPTWANAHEYRNFTLMLMHTGDQVKTHLANLKAALGGGLLLHDFPHLRPGRPWTQTDARTVGGCRFVAAGMDKTILGLRDLERRFNLIIGSDLDAGSEDFTPHGKAKGLGRLTNDVFRAASPHAAIALEGTPTARGSLMHDVVRAARGKPGALEDRGQWVRAAGFDPYYFPAIVDEGTPAERSAWESRHPLVKLKARQRAMPREFALQDMCDPDDPAAAQWWTDDERTSVFRYDEHFDAVWHILSIDPANTRGAGSDKSALVVLGVGPGVGEQRAVCVERAIAGHWSRTEVKAHAHALTQQYRRTLRTWIVDATGSGDDWTEALRPYPAAVDVVPFTTTQDSKRYRIETLFDDYCRGAVWHAAALVGLEAQMCAWTPSRSGPGVDDLIDAVRAAKDYALYGDASRSPKRRMR